MSFLDKNGKNWEGVDDSDFPTLDWSEKMELKIEIPKKEIDPITGEYLIKEDCDSCGA